LLFEVLSGGYAAPEDEDLASALGMQGPPQETKVSLRSNVEALSQNIESCV